MRDYSRQKSSLLSKQILREKLFKLEQNDRSTWNTVEISGRSIRINISRSDQHHLRIIPPPLILKFCHAMIPKNWTVKIAVFGVKIMGF
ncbi:hypothetical protein DRA42_05275 [Ethanoligenens harbinense]|nr:hypothetical protein CXQ68_05260 [Ethanoligenens harbinense YUAN-3]AYF38357.1 hypothetical protein CXP51_05120 [Ethanoligenens harbinense]AYF41102.1 hypothetical protein CN246_05250 [Ethanoligenens harbinense]QCN91933.1 hypothetical protein DRA42_05275 [Ethanoligenens harbinense]